MTDILFKRIVEGSLTDNLNPQARKNKDGLQPQNPVSNVLLTPELSVPYRQ